MIKETTEIYIVCEGKLGICSGEEGDKEGTEEGRSKNRPNEKWANLDKRRCTPRTGPSDAACE